MSGQEDLYPEVQKDPAGVAHIKGCFIWRINRITRDIGVQADWYEAVHKVYPHLTREDITTAFAYGGDYPDEIEAHIKHSYELDGTAHKRRMRRQRLDDMTVTALDLLRMAVVKLKTQGAEPGAIFLGRKYRWYLMPHRIDAALGKEHDPSNPNDHLFGLPVIRKGEETFVISTPQYSRCVFAEDRLPEPAELLDMDA